LSAPKNGVEGVYNPPMKFRALPQPPPMYVQ
jgi:hypothetical protein